MRLFNLMKIKNLPLLLVSMLMIMCTGIPAAAASDEGVVYVIRSHSFTAITVDPGYSVFVEAAIEKASRNPATKAIILEINTPGGRVDTALTLKDTILSADIPVMGFINSHAISAGALIALATQPLLIVEGGVIGNAAPVFQSGGEMKRADEKAVSALRGVFAGLAERFGRPIPVAMAMVDSDIVLTIREHGISKPKDKLLTLTAEDALRLGIVDGIHNSLHEVLQAYGLDQYSVEYIDFSAKQQIISFLTNPIMTSILLTLGMLGLIFEVRTPGWGVGGTIGILSLALFFFSQIISNQTTWGAPVVFLLGLALIIIEVFLIPGFGLVGVAGIGLILFSFLMAIGVHDLRYGARLLAISLVATAVISALSFKFLPKTKLFSKIVLSNSCKEFHSPTDHDRFKIKKNDSGTALSTLRPSGIVEINGEKLDAVSEGGFIKAGTAVSVIRIDGFRVIVREDAKT